MEPAIAPRRRRRLRIAVIALRDFPGSRRPQDQLADIAMRHLDVVPIHDTGFHARARLATGAKHLGIGAGPDRHRRLRHVESRAHQQSVTFCHGARILVPGHGHHVAQRMIAITVARWLPQQELRHGADQAAPGDVESTNGVPERRGLEPVVKNAGAALGQPIHDRAGATDVEQWQIRQHAVVGIGIVHPHRAATPGLDVGADDGFRRTGRPGCQDDEVRIHRLDGSVGLCALRRVQDGNVVATQRTHGVRRVPDNDHVPQLCRLDLHQPRQQAGVRHHHRGVRQLDGMLQQSSAIARIDRHVHGAKVICGEPRQDGFGGVRHPAQHVRSLLHAE